MPETYRAYNTFEVAIALWSKGPGAGGIDRVQEGDIVAIRKPLWGIGSKEATHFLWLRIEGLDDNDMTALAAPIEGFEKRRYCIPLERLKAVMPQLDLVKARDTAQIHQPALTIDQDGPYYWVAESKPFTVHGLVYDKTTGRFL